MSELISQIANAAGMDNETTQNGLGALLATVKEYVPEDTFSGLANAIPGAGSILSNFQSLPDGDSGGGIDLMGMAAGLLGGQSEQLSTLISMFSKGGFSIDMIKDFLPVVFNYFQNNQSGVIEKIEEAIPGLSDLLGGSTGGGLIGKISSLF